jgi:hypothetical protein
MDFVIKGRSSIFIKEEVTEGTYIAPVATSEAIEVLEDFTGFDYSRNTVNSKVLSATVESKAPRNGLPEVSGSLPTEFKAGATEGAAPRSDLLLKSLLGDKRNVASAVTSSTGHSTTVINLADADINKFKAGDSVLIKKTGAHCIRPIASVSNSLGAANITLAIPAPYTPPNAVVIAPVTTYFFGEDEPSLSISAELGGVITEKAAGCKVETAEIGNWTTGEIPEISFSMKALSLDKIDSVSGLEPDFSAEPQPPVALNACAYIDGVELDYNEFSLSIANTIAELKSACKLSGKVGSRKTKLLVTGSINPYMETDNVDRFDKFKDSTPVSLFVHIANPASVAGEYENVGAIWLPQVVFTSVKNGDEEGSLTDELEFQAYKEAGNDTIFMSFI